MHIEQYTDAIRNCRFCFMCRHLSGVGNVTFTEADTPRIRASLIYGLAANPDCWKDSDFIDTIYRSDLSAACRRNCVNHYDENGLNLAARADIVEKGLAPEYVKQAAAKLNAMGAWQVAGDGDVVYLADRYSVEAGADKAFAKIMAAKNVKYRTVSGGCLGKGLNILGFLADAKRKAEEFAAFVGKLGAKTIVVSNPAAYDALVNDYMEFGIALNAKVMHTSEYILSLAPAFTQKAGDVYYLESDYLRNYCGDYEFPHKLLENLGAVNRPFGTNDEESYSCGEGAVLLPEFDAELVKELAEYVAERADHPETDVIVTASPYTKIQLGKYTCLNVVTLEELAAQVL